MLREPFERLPGEIEPVEREILPLERHDDAQALCVVIEPAETLHEPIERPLARMSERWMPEVVRQRQGLRQIFVEAKLARHRTRDLRHLEAVRQPRPEVVALVIDEYLRLMNQAP